MFFLQRKQSSFHLGLHFLKKDSAIHAKKKRIRLKVRPNKRLQYQGQNLQLLCLQEREEREACTLLEEPYMLLKDLKNQSLIFFLLLFF